MTTYQEAYDDICAAIYEKVSVDAASLLGYEPSVVWPSVPSDVQDGSKFWLRVAVQTVEQRQESLSTCAGLPGRVRYRTDGLAFVQIFCPKSDRQFFQKGQALADLLRAAFRGKSTAGSVWFRNARIQEAGSEDLFYRFNVVSEFTYDETA